MSLLDSFDLQIDPGSGNVTGLTYAFNPIDTATITDGISINFPFTVTGTDVVTGRPFEYQYTESTQSFSAVPEPSSLALLGIGVAGLLGYRVRQRRNKRRNCSQ